MVCLRIPRLVLILNIIYLSIFSEGMSSGGDKAVNIPVGILDCLLVILEIAIKDLLRHTLSIPFTQHITGWAAFVIGITLNKKEKESHFICHQISLLR